MRLLLIIIVLAVLIGLALTFFRGRRV